MDRRLHDLSWGAPVFIRLQDGREIEVGTLLLEWQREEEWQYSAEVEPQLIRERNVNQHGLVSWETSAFDELHYEAPDAWHTTYPDEEWTAS